ncbi:MAG: acyloxyacyl hydrolase [Dysgonamonadaceae bacterium]|jgi:hypothetical protein|nr:acyloxyacyl hydrolase [Dysgonamonadaceae bacterium]
MSKYCLLLLFLLKCSYELYAQNSGNKEPWSVEGTFFYGKIIKHDEFVKSTLQNGPSGIYDLKLSYTDFFSDAAAGYNFPAYGVGFSVVDFSAVKLYHASDLGNIYALYLFWNQRLLDFGRFRWTCQGDIGPVYNTDTFDPILNPGKDFSSSSLMMYVGIATGLKYCLSHHWEIGIDAYTRHYSNGRLGVINKGFNIAGGNLSLAYRLPHKEYKSENDVARPIRKSFYYHFSAGGGVQTYIEDWMLYLHGASGYREGYVEKYHPKYFVSTDVMYRFSREYGSGIGVDLFYMPSLDSFRAWDKINPKHEGEAEPEYRPWSTGITLNQEVYYKNLALTASLGYYLYRKSGWREETESPVYERFGLRYYFPKWDNLFGGCSIKAHKFRMAEYFELSAGKKF